MFLLNPVQGSDLQRIIIPQASLMAIFVYPPSAEITIDILKNGTNLYISIKENTACKIL